MIKLYFLFLILSLSGCATLNTDPHTADSQLTRIIQLEQEVTKLKYTKKCNVFVLPILERVPNINIEGYQKIPLTEKDARLSFLVKYIETLRAYISDSKSTLREGYSTYLKECIS